MLRSLTVLSLLLAVGMPLSAQTRNTQPGMAEELDQLQRIYERNMMPELDPPLLQRVQDLRQSAVRLNTRVTYRMAGVLHDQPSGSPIPQGMLAGLRENPNLLSLNIKTAQVGG